MAAAAGLDGGFLVGAQHELALAQRLPNQWGFAIWLASRDAYQDSVLPSGMPVGTAEEALDCACGLYLNDPTAWQAE